jgi:hypothetical protein
MWSKFLPTLNFFQKWKDFCVEFLHIWIQFFSILKFNLKRNSKIEIIQIYHFLSSLLSFHSFVCTCTIIACKIWCSFVAYLSEFSKKIGKFDFFLRNIPQMYYFIAILTIRVPYFQVKYLKIFPRSEN